MDTHAVTWGELWAYWRRMYSAALLRTLQALQIKWYRVPRFAILLVVTLLGGGIGLVLHQVVAWGISLAAAVGYGALLLMYFCKLIPAEEDHDLRERLNQYERVKRAPTLADLPDIERELLSQVDVGGQFRLTQRNEGDVVMTGDDWTFGDPQNPKARLRYLEALEELKAKGVVRAESDRLYSLSLDGWRLVEELAKAELLSIVATHGQLTADQDAALEAMTQPDLDQWRADFGRRTGRAWSVSRVWEVWATIPDAYKTPNPELPEDRLSPIGRRYLRATRILQQSGRD